MNRSAEARPNLCTAVFRAWLAFGLATLAWPGALDATTPAGPLAAWLVAMPLACLVVLEPCRACLGVLRLATVRTRMRPQARRLSR